MIMPANLVFFGEAERGEFSRPYFCHNLSELLDCLGEPPPYSRGLHFAIQALLYDRWLYFFRVQEEGYSYQDYFQGLRLLTQQQIPSDRVVALCAPGVSDKTLLDVIHPICQRLECLFITNEADLYDYLMLYPRTH